jgi:hypothetical protein
VIRRPLLKYHSLLSILVYIITSSELLIAQTNPNVINFSDSKDTSKNVSALVRSLIQKAPKKNLKITFQKGVYHFSPEGSFKKIHNITNHENGEKNIAFLFEGFENLEIDANGSSFIFTGQMLPFLFENCNNVTLKNCSIDWDIPFFIQGEVVHTDRDAETYDIRLYSDGYCFKLQNDRLIFPNQSGFSFSGLGESLVFDKNTRSPVFEANKFDIQRNKDIKVNELENGNARLYEKLKNYPVTGSIITFKGPMSENRYAPAIHAKWSKNISIEHVNVYHALGMGFLGEHTENIHLNSFNVKVPEGSDRMISTIADATHFCNCRGNVLVENSLFENMLDDGTNVHGTYVKIDSILGHNKVKASLQHFQQSNFDFAQNTDSVWFIIAPSVARSNENVVSKCVPVNSFSMEITFKNPLPASLRKGDLIENKTWNTQSFTMRNCTIRNNRARNIVLKTPGKTLIENNYFHSMMASILLRGEAFFWYESGANENVEIRNNTFENCTYGGGNQALLFISPRFNKSFDKTALFDRNIIFENNIIKTFDNKIVDASNVDKLTIRNNVIIQTKMYKPFNPTCPLIDLHNCKNAEIEGNRYENKQYNFLRVDQKTLETANIDSNMYF